MLLGDRLFVVGFVASCRCRSTAESDLFTTPGNRKNKARFPEAKRFVSLPFSFASVTKPARGLNCDEVRCDRKKKIINCSFFMYLLYVFDSTWFVSLL